MSYTVPFNPLDTKNLGAAVADALLRADIHPLGELPAIDGAGIYAIYYHGAFPAYARLASAYSNSTIAPIYVGRAIPEGARKGGGQGDNDAPSKSLIGRLRDHAKSIRLASDLHIEDFVCQYLVVEDIWIPLAETLLIARFAPVWNTLVDGFGNHTPGKGRYAGKRPRWDVLHPGRTCAPRSETFEEISRDVENYLRERLG